jgi:hypothetical protein
MRDASTERAQVGQPAPDTVFADTAGREIRLSDFWRLQTTAFLFLRHFG